MVTMAHFAQTFARFDHAQRQHALALLTAELTPHEWRYLHALTSSRSFQLDIVGHLPIELIAHVFTYLDPAAPYRYQVVSTRWRHILRDLVVLKAGLIAWYQGAACLSDFEDYASCQRAAKRIHGFRTGRPVGIYKITSDKQIACPSLVGDYLVWLSGTTQTSALRLAHIFNLHNWHVGHAAGEAREQLVNLVLSEQIVVLVTATNTCYVYRLPTLSQRKKFSVPSARYLQNVTCRRRTVACLASLDEYMSVFIWDYDTQRGTSFNISKHSDMFFGTHGPRHLLHTVPLLQPESETIVFMFILPTPTETPDSTLFVCAIYTFRGDCVSSFRPSLPELRRLSVGRGVMPFVPVDDSGNVFAARVITTSPDSPPTNPSIVSLLLRFDTKTNDVRVCEGPVNRNNSPSDIEKYRLYLWKDTWYACPPVKATDIIHYMGTQDKAICVPVLSDPYTQVTDVDTLTESFFLNERYVVRAMSGDIHLLCFHESSVRPTTGGDFFGNGMIRVLS
ncbi:hypothetical protein J3E71DRAFT_353748 [Bipolaris maydis]|nr:hypothetical protein J3E71DRAFT_353748 [Bipolaris maydis]